MTQLEIQGVLHTDSHMFAQEYFYQAEPEVVISIMTQLSFNAGLKEWGDKAHSASNSDMKQLQLRNTLIPMKSCDMIYEEIQMVLEPHKFLKHKRDGKIKVLTVAGGNKQQIYITKEDSSSTTFSTESVILTSIVDAEENRDVTVIDIPNAFIQMRVEEKKHGYHQAKRSLGGYYIKTFFRLQGLCN